jgi:hypothetical protein
MTNKWNPLHISCGIIVSTSTRKSEKPCVEFEPSNMFCAERWLVHFGSVNLGTIFVLTISSLKMTMKDRCRDAGTDARAGQQLAKLDFRVLNRT